MVCAHCLSSVYRQSSAAVAYVNDTYMVVEMSCEFHDYKKDELCACVFKTVCVW